MAGRARPGLVALLLLQLFLLVRGTSLNASRSSPQTPRPGDHESHIYPPGSQPPAAYLF